MLPDPALRNFKKGSWDLRKRDRRERQSAISFPDRRRQDRRTFSADSVSNDIDLTWVSRPRLDE
jgi:hypothetical protein